MISKKGLLIKITLSIVFLFIFGIIGNIVLYPIFIPDECYFHGNETSVIVEILFDFPSYNGYHPVPSKFIYILFALTGFILGSLLHKRTVTNSRKMDILDQQENIPN